MRGNDSTGRIGINTKSFIAGMLTTAGIFLALYALSIVGTWVRDNSSPSEFAKAAEETVTAPMLSIADLFLLAFIAIVLWIAVTAPYRMPRP